MSAEITITDGQTHVGQVVERGKGFDAFDADGDFICQCATLAEARDTVTRTYREHLDALDRMVDDGGVAA